MSKRDSTKQKKTWPPIRPRGNSWMVDTQHVFEKRRRVTFKTLAEAEQYAADCRIEREEKKSLDRHERKNRAVSLANLNDTQRAEVLEAYRLLNRPRGLVDAVQFYVRHNTPTANEKPLEAIYDDYLESKRLANRRARTLANIEKQVGPFAYEHKDRATHTITTSDVEAYLRARAKGATSFNIYRTALLGLFNFAVRRGATERNPVEAIEKASTDTAIPAILTVNDARSLLHAAAQLHPDMIPYLAIGLFAGLRPENELRNLLWKNIHLGKGQILVTAASAKKRRDRYVEIQPNLGKWLAMHRQDGGNIYYSRRKLRSICAAANITWSKDVMRHSFGSYHMAAFQDDARTAKQMGHTSGSSVLFEHYKHLVEPTEAAQFWKITPTQNKIIKLNQEVA